MTRFKRFVAVTCLSLLFAASIGVPAALAAPVAEWESISLNVGSSSNESVLIVAGVLPESTKLPATVTLVAPTGSTLQWAGEILGGDASADPEVATTKAQSDGQDLYTFTLTKSRTAQLEVTTQSPITVNGDVYTVTFSQPAWTDVPEAGVAIQIPVSARLTEPATATAGLAAGPTGYQYYQQQFTAVKKGQPLGVTFSYTLAAATPGAATTTGTGGALIPAILVAIAVALGAGLFIGVRRKLSGDAEYEDGAAEEEEEDEYEEEAAVTVAPTKPQAAQAASKKAVAEEVIEDSEPDAKPRTNIALIGTLVIIALAVGAGVIAASQGGQAKSVGTRISKTFAGGEACTSSDIALTIPENVDPSDASEQIFAAIAPVPSITDATIDLSTSSINVAYCDSSANEDMIRQALAPTGYMAAGSAIAPSGAASGAVDASGTTP